VTPFRKKPVVIEAIQYANNDYADNPLEFHSDPPQWLRNAIDDGTVRPEFRSEDYWYLVIHTLEGNMDVTPGDWIIQGIKGELYPCKPDIFDATYEPVSGTPEQT
jgi:hypothetical protein